MRSRKTTPKIYDVTYLLNRELFDCVKRIATVRFHGKKKWRVLDVGCGDMPYRHLIEPECKEYQGCDLYSENPEVTQCAADDLAFGDNSFDAVVCFQVLEHVPEPWKVLAEIQRVLKPGGIVILTVPFVFANHSSPHDYYRYTPMAIRHLSNNLDLTVEDVQGQVNSLANLFLLFNWNWQVYSSAILARLPFGWLLSPFRSAVVVVANVIGACLGTKWLTQQAEAQNSAFANYSFILKKPAELDGELHA